MLAELHVVGKAQEIVVQKYGGTSVGSVDRIKLVAQRVARCRSNGQKVAVVVSAMSGETNRLVSLVNEINPKGNRRHYDMAVAAGEQVSVALLANALEAEGCPAMGLLAYQLGIQTNRNHGGARIQSIDCHKILELWERGITPVIAGFQGVTPDLELTTLGRGGSDTSGVALAVALQADLCEINTDVDGVFTADPRMVPEARLLKVLDYESALELAAMGSKVLHPRCVELAMKYKMPVRVRNSFDKSDVGGTMIVGFSEKNHLEAPVVSGVTVDGDVVRVSLTGLANHSGVFADVFGQCAEHGVNIDVISHNEAKGSDSRRLGFTCGHGDLDRVQEALAAYQKQEPDCVFAIQEGLAKVSIVGIGMVSHSGVACRTFDVLAKAGVEVVMISTSEIKITTVVPKAQSAAAARALHGAFISTLEDSEGK